MRNKKLCIAIIILLLGVIVGLVVYMKKDKEEPVATPPDKTVVSKDGNFDYKIIKQVNSGNKENYMISPLSIAYALSIVKDGADGNTLKEIETLLGNYKLDKTINIKDKISIANLLFIKNKWKNDIDKDYIKTIQNNYDSDLLFDEFTTPDVINNWVSEKTFKMIPKVVNQISPDFVLGVANAIAIDVEWKDKFDCHKTEQGDFTSDNNQKMKTAYMKSSNDVTYLENDKARGIIKDYASYNAKTGEITYEKDENTVELEYIAILPNGDLKEYINNFSKDELNNLIKTGKRSSSKLDIYYSLPKYKYDYDYGKFKQGLINLGMKDAFNEQTANFSKMINKNSDLRVYINEAIHKSHIEITENGTKASAVTIFMFMEATAIMEEPKRIDINFDKPFLYIIKEKNSDNIWFFGTVYTPIKWEDNVSECDYK